MEKKKSLEQSIEKTIDVLGKLDIDEDFREFEKYQVFLNEYVSEYKAVIETNSKSRLFKQ